MSCTEGKTLVVKILWSTSMSISLERRCTWRKDKQRYEYKNIESLSAQFRRFNAQLKALGYDEAQVRVIARVDWKDSMRQPEWDEFYDLDDWAYGQIFVWDNNKENIFKIIPLSKAFVAKELWEMAYLSNGLMWDPARGHFNPSLDVAHQLANQVGGTGFSAAEMHLRLPLEEQSQLQQACSGTNRGESGKVGEDYGLTELFERASVFQGLSLSPEK
jgi:hypothetical protein